MNFRDAAQAAVLAGAVCGTLVLTACGMPAAPQPPSLNLPQPVKDLAANRVGDEVSLTWTMPTRDTSKVGLKPDQSVAVRICRSETTAGPCTTVGNQGYAPGAAGSFNQALPADLASGSPRPLHYYVELTNRRGRSAGFSNAATVLAGQAPVPVSGLTAELRKDGVLLRWTPGPPELYDTQIRLQRTLLTPQPQKQQGPLAAPAEPVQQDLLVPSGRVRGGALDKDISFGETYAYRVQRIAQLTLDGKRFEFQGPLSAPVRINADNVFPPEVPTGLAAVATPAENGAGPSIDLSWQPDAEPNVAGYAVYRRELPSAEAQPTPWQRVSGAQPVVGPGFHDPNVAAGGSYEYAITAIGQNGRESGKSSPAQESVPPQ